MRTRPALSSSTGMLRGPLALTLALLLTPALGAAQPADPARDAEARVHFQAGRDAFARGDFSSAATEFERAYALSRRPQLLYNIGRAYQEQLRLEEASRAFQRYLDALPDAPDRAEVEGRLRIIDVAMSHAVPPPPVEPPPTRVVVVERPVEAPPPEAHPWRTAFWVTGGLSLLTGAGTIALGVFADQRYQELLRSCAPQCRQDDVSDMSLRAGLVNGGIILSSALLATSITAFIIDRSQRRAPTGVLPRVGVAPTAGGATMLLEGRF